MKYVIFAIILSLFTGIIWFAQQANHPRPIVDEQAMVLPAITRQQILNASDFTQGIKTAVQTNNMALIDTWFTKAIELAETAKLSQQDLDYLQSELARKVAIFQAKRSLFNDEIEQAYYSIQDIQPIKAAYPEAQDLFDQVDSVIKQRNILIEKIATELADGQVVTEQTLQAAKQQWQSRFADKTAQVVDE